MGLATPTAIAVGVGRVSREGILIKSGQVLENLASIKKVIFDKTGTLTTGEFEISYHSLSGDPVINKEIIYELETRSSHPIAKAVVNIFSREGVNGNGYLVSIDEMKGEGMHGLDGEGNKYLFGNSRSGHSDDSKSKRIYLYKNDQPQAWIELSDTQRLHAKETIEDFKNAMITPFIVSGDRETEVQEIAEKLDIETYYAEVLPAEKIEILNQMRADNPIAMVGDGINDAAALAKADVGISLSTASQIAINSADVVILHNDLSLLSKAYRISKATLLTIKQNLFWAFSYNIIAIPLAAFGFLNPMWGAFFMAFSDIIVIGNSIRLKFKKI
jgi:Cu+-exporting ATPase